MGLMSRMSTVVKAKMSKMLDRAEDPNETLDYSYQQQLEMLQRVKRGVADVVTSKKRLQLQAKKLEENVVKLDGQARQAIAGGREDLARLALQRKQEIQTQLQGMDSQITGLEAQQEKLIDNERKLTAKIEGFRTRKEVIKAQYSAAEAQVRINESVTGISESMADVGLAVQRAEEKTESMTARAAAMDELIEAGTLDDMTSDKTHLDRELEQLSSSSTVDSELAALKAQLGSGQAAPKELAEGAGQPAAPAEGQP